MKDLVKWDFYLARICYEIYLLRVVWGSKEEREPKDFLMYLGDDLKIIEPRLDDERPKKVIVYQPPPPPKIGPDGKRILDPETIASMNKSKAFWADILGRTKLRKPQEKKNIGGEPPEVYEQMKKVQRRRRI